jgi:hypothetical protein
MGRPYEEDLTPPKGRDVLLVPLLLSPAIGIMPVKTTDSGNRDRSSPCAMSEFRALKIKTKVI